MHIPHFLYPSINHFYPFYVMPIMNDAAINMRMKVSSQDPDLNSLSFYPETGLLEHLIVLFIYFFIEFVGVALVNKAI